ncbi:efflux RND transporter periplasmic adaptor subunit [Acinetobacter gerneri]|nr:efflux RND transporter periplasmic adaptor subunit [Acinetobacter gerneri]MDQ9011853.1 efflux RND transporter periplasmic adaptor subunit [Acinetobacter gerneri]MDQ9015958.1 efflux RND transporter periplasmic adaptor subunit [Acinetobacter gerneri]MDQ9027129.1 efflux RND transporter periplasmic adaptor subunit [Acinetobacter gerneri]MDQ9054398.1 efflux RND transporter periplasmic adaptor subunit [Acinetobacter gerneri]MDQ9062080.1 efflux RND transporter periplasmic adaptor subunit [Acinetob
MPIPQVPVAEVITQELNPTAEYTGYLSAPQSVEIKSRVGGVINSVSVPEGSYVRKGQVLFKIDPAPFQVALKTAQARLKAAEVQYSQAVLDFNRANKLVESGAVSNKVYDDALATKNNRQAQVQEAQAAVSAAKLDLSYTNITAPISGRIDRVLVTSGNLIAGGNTGNATALTTIVSVNPLYVYFDLDEKTFLNLKGQNKSGQFNLPIEMGLANTETYPYTGKLNFVSTQIDQRTGTLRVRASITNDSGELAPGMFARV